MNAETAREKLAARLCGAFTNRPFSVQSGEVREIWRGRADAMLQVVREIAADELREAADDIESRCVLTKYEAGSCVRDRADALHPAGAPS